MNITPMWGGNVIKTKDTSYEVAMARIAVDHAIKHLDEARGLYCAKGNPDRAILAEIADHQDDLAEIRDKIKGLMERVE